ncbi:camp-dependent protein kinase catalytic subunit beta [Globomyces pollinis-pini]|nr:camp-dependent protein kinase catalytic subunit beta [Globomyces pollinis-pini]
MPKYELGSQDYLAPGETLSLNDFKLIKLIGKGGFAKVYQSVRKMDHRIFAIKVMRKDQLRQTKQSAHIMNEKSILQSSRGENFIVQLLGTFQDDIHLYMVQEFLSGGDLFGYIKLHGHLSEVHSKFYAAEILLGLEFLHEKGIVYRDLKPENILFDNHGHIKIADLGFAKQLNGGYTTTFCGTPSYLAPEVILRKPYNMMVDWWTFGVICFQLCSGCSPFQESTPPKTFSRIIHANIRWPPEPQLYFSNDVFDLIMRLFEINPKERLNGNLIKSHEWFQDIDFHDLNLRKITPPHIVHTNVRRRSISLDPNAPTELRRASTILPDHTELSAGEIPTRSTNNLFEGF